jgi:hypothetical protein
MTEPYASNYASGIEQVQLGDTRDAFFTRKAKLATKKAPERHIPMATPNE